MSRKAEINDFDLRILRLGLEQEVLRLQVSMDDLLLIVTVGNGIQDRPDQVGGVVLAEMALLALCFGNNAVKELPAGAQLGD